MLVMPSLPRFGFGFLLVLFGQGLLPVEAFAIDVLELLLLRYGLRGDDLGQPLQARCLQPCKLSVLAAPP